MRRLVSLAPPPLGTAQAHAAMLYRWNTYKNISQNLVTVMPEKSELERRAAGSALPEEG